MSKTPRIPIPEAVRRYVFDRDRWQCKGCGQKGNEATLEIDHIVPLALGGSNDISNLQVLCRSCNRQKGGRGDRRFRRRFKI